MYKHLISSFVLATLYFSAYCQQNDNIAFAGKHAIFIFHGFAPASPQFPDAAGNTGFALQRREVPGAITWVTVNNFHSPQNLDELIANYNLALALLPNARKVTFNPAEAWQKWQKYKRYDSLVNEVGYAPGQIAFSILVADTAVQAGKTYQYRIVKNIVIVATDSSFVSNQVAYPAHLEMPVPKFLKRQTERDAIIISWYSKGFKSVDNFNVYRSTGNSKVFAFIKPGIRVVQHQDSAIYTLVDNNVVFSEMYQYYIEPVNGFSGGGNIISDTIPATCMNPQQLQTPQDIYTKPDVSRKAIVLNYTLPNQSYIGSVHVLRSQHFDTGYAEVGINGAGDTSYVDMRVRPGVKYYYYLIMTDKMGRNSPRSIKTFGLYQDTANDQAPRFTGTEKVAGGIKITWQNPPLKKEISGYYVYRSAGGGSSFQRISLLLSVKDSVNIFIDTAKNLSPGMLYSYCVQSENLSNKLSKNSNTAFIKTDDPASVKVLFTPRNVKALIENNHARLVWYDMRILNNNLSYYRILRKTEDDKEFKAVAEKYPAVFTSYYDTTLQPGQAYEYAIESSDGSGHTSAQVSTNIIRMKDEVLPSPIISLFKTTDGISLSWGDIQDARIHNYNIYRYAKGDKPEKIGNVSAKESSYADKNIAAGKMYYYYIEADAENRSLKIMQSNTVYVMINSN